MEGEPDSGPSTGQTSSSSKPTPKHEASATTSGNSGAGGASNTQLSKRRRGLGVVTPNACTECRKKRAKCDGQKPCGRCKSQKDVECIYEIPVRQSKENLRHEIEALRRQQRQSDSVFSALVRPELVEEVLQRLRQGQSVEGISEWLGGTSLPAAGGALPGFARPNEPRGGVTLPPLSTYGGTLAGPGGYNTMGMSPATAQTHGMNQEFDPNSPWNFSSHSQTVSTRSDSHPDIMQWTAEAPPRSRVGLWLQDQSSPATEGARYRGVDQVLAPIDSPEMKVPPESWTAVTSDGSLVSHLLALYFCWEYPTFASLSKEHFLRDFRDGRERYCSPILVNALLALGCRFSTQPNTRANPNDPRTAGDHFFKESLRLFYREQEHHNLTTIQALGIMSIREASCGRDSESWYYAGQSIRLAIEMGLHRLQNDGDEDELAVQAATFWGAFALDHAWSLATGSLPQCSCFPHLPPKPAIIDDIEASLWVPYTDDGAPLQRSCEQPSNVRSVYKCFCELSELVHQSLYVLHSPGKPVTSRDLLSIYTQYLNWYDRIPEVLRLGHNFTPAVLFAHMYYHFAILLLFRPLIKLRIIGSSILPRDVCAQAADAIQGLLRSYSQLYTLRRTPSFVPYFVLTSSIMHLAVGAEASKGQSTSPTELSNPLTVKPEDSEVEHGTRRLSSSHRDDAEPTSPSSTITAKLSPRVAGALSQGIAHLTEMAPCHHFAHQALNILQYLAKKWNIEVDIPPSTGVSQEIDNSVRPTTSSLNFFSPNVNEEDFLCAWGTRDVGGPGGAQRRHSSPTPQAHVGRGEKMEGIIEESRMREAAEQDPVPSFAPGSGVGPMAHSAKSLENPLFWPFPMQGRPMLPEGKELEKAGFRPL
ncbi:nitrogen assimilation transcription factor nirA [Hypoxylon trugodes]|uniref:nitrogen assimilation transcription factor nirA n=1 Tax=Hypoxylon trugodes TaxID=326681 RepID=UPI00219257FD|nr:nitrogen assimilation transcription factor nirA [Hypoxylon trugodes]KAI1391792.1 nitrogen assimilation transcription factor nirA [Hypoxylon trugodes]